MVRRVITSWSFTLFKLNIFIPIKVAKEISQEQWENFSFVVWLTWMTDCCHFKSCPGPMSTCSAPSYFHSLMTIYIPSRSLTSASEQRLAAPSQRGSKSLSRTFSFTVPDRWIPDNLQATTENSSLSTLLDLSLNKKTVFLFIYSFTC